MRGLLARVLSTLLGGLAGFIFGSLLDSSYSSIFASWEDILKGYSRYVAPQFQEGLWLSESRRDLGYFVNILIGTGFAVGYFFTPLIEYLLIGLTEYLSAVARRTSRQRFIVTSIGVFSGMVVSGLIINAPLFFYLASLRTGILSQPFFTAILHVVIVLIFGYAGGFLASAVFFPPTGKESILAEYGAEGKPRILDTSVLIDGRIVEILKTRFIPGVIVVPNSVVRELQLIADSSDQLKRAKGRRGLDILNQLEASVPNPIHFYDDSKFDAPKMSVDDIIIEIASALDAEVITNDYNLNRVAAIKKVTVLNINELANAVKPMLIPGETLKVSILKHGKEPGQGVGYLEDGTMVIVEAGERYIGNACEVEVTSVVQTVAGRLIFSKIRRILGAEKE